MTLVFAGAEELVAVLGVGGGYAGEFGKTGSGAISNKARNNSTSNK